MIVVTVVLRLQSKRAESARQVLGRLVGIAKQTPGVNVFNLGEDIQSPGVFYLTEVYESASAREHFESSSEFTAALGALGLFFTSPPEVASYAVDAR